MNLEPGQSIGHYRIVRPLGQGGMGAVFLAEDTKLDRKVALKVLPTEMAQSADRIERFRREAKSVAALNHPHIVTLFSVEEDAGTHYLTMEWVEGESLDHTLPPSGLALPKVFDIGIALADALGAAHERGIIHRDLKPANVIVTKDGRVKVLDFGLAKLLAEQEPAPSAPDATATVAKGETLTAAGTIMGTMPYMSPEQIGGEALDARSDIFSLGVVLYELATGRRPFAGKNPAETASAILRDAPRPLAESRQDAPRQLVRIVDHCLQKDPDARFQTAKDVRNELRALRQEVESGAVERRKVPSSGRYGTWKLELGAAVVAVVALGIWLLVRDKPAAPAETKPVASASSAGPAAAAAETSSLAVLPFVDMSADKDQEYFSDGLTEELLNALVKIPDLKVTGRTSSFAFKGKTEDLRTIGEKLGVANILEGSVRKSGDKIRVTAQLVKVADGFHLWSQTYDRTLDDIFAVQDDIARSVAQKLQVTLLGQAKEKPDAEAYDLVLQARFVMQAATRDSVRRAREMLERALSLSPDYAPAWAEIGLAHGREVELASTSEDRRRASERMREALAKALALDPQLAVTHSRMALVQMADWDFEAAQDSAEKALAADPKNPIPLANAATVYASLGRTEQANALLERAVEADPLNPISLSNLAGNYAQVGRLTEAEALCRRAIALRPDHPGAYVILGTVQFIQGKTDEARASFDQFGKLAGQEELFRLFSAALFAHARGDDAASEAAAAEFEERFGKADPFASAQIRAWCGNKDAAFAWLERAVAARDPLVASIKAEPLLRPLHDDPRWNALLKRIGLPTD